MNIWNRKWTRDAFWMVVSFAALIGIWWGIVWLFETPSYLLPAPDEVLWSGRDNGLQMIPHSGWTILSVLAGYLLAVVVGVPLAIIVVSSQTLERILYPPMVATQSIPKIALAPLFVVWFGFGMFPKVAVAFLICFFPNRGGYHRWLAQHRPRAGAARALDGRAAKADLSPPPPAGGAAEHVRRAQGGLRARRGGRAHRRVYRL